MDYSTRDWIEKAYEQIKAMHVITMDTFNLSERQGCNVNH